VTKISNEGTARCEIMMRSGLLIHQDHELSIRVNEYQEFNFHREDEESQLPERLRNISITPSDA
jgi:hypothetical protein